jgi:hypothetical protein
LQVQVGGTAFDLNLEPHRSFARLAGIPTSPTTNRAYSLARVLRLVFGNGFVMVAEQLRGQGTTRPAGFYAWDELVASPQSEPYALPIRLFALKNGSQENRARFARIVQAFESLAPGRSFDVSFEATTLPPVASPAEAPFADAEAMPPGLGAAVTVLILQGGRDDRSNRRQEIPVAQVGAGTWEALVVAEAMAQIENRVTVLDEPALNLHPTWQHLLRTQLREAVGQIILITHSPNLVPMSEQSDLDRLVRFENERGATRAHRLPVGLDPEMVTKITREFALSADARALLFARGAVLVEGETELGVLPTWFREAAEGARIATPDELDLGFYCVGGDSNFKPMITLLHGLGIPFAVICDGAIFNVEGSRTRHIFTQVCNAGVDAPQLVAFLREKVDGPGKTKMTQELFERQQALGRANGIFTLARGWTTANKKLGTAGDESFEAFLDVVAQGKLEEAASTVGPSKVRRGRWIAEIVSCPNEVAQCYSEMFGRLGAR